ncbi:hypothetical protein LUZ60_013737 [Juncus effusus]|nr:hypothetical protein LUZ60_013737 [Juncus effusus]
MRIAVNSPRSTYPLIVAKKNKHKPPKGSANNAARRITSNVKLNLQIVKELKKNNKTNEPKVRTSFRRKKGAKDSKELLEDSDPNNITEEEWEETGDPVTLIDGYNLCGFWDKLKPDFKAGRLDSARDKLLIPLIKYSKITGERIVVVYDAHKSGNCRNKDNFFGVDIVFSGRLEADDWIIKEVENLRKAHHPVLVVSSDIMVQNESLELGASVWSCSTFVRTIEDSEEVLKKDSFEQRRARMEDSYHWPISLRKKKKKKNNHSSELEILVEDEEEDDNYEDPFEDLYEDEEEIYDALYETDKRFW